MSDKSGIAWTDATWNPSTGCTKVSPGCKNCYAKHQAWPRLAAMKTGVYSGRVFEDVQVHPERLDQPLRWTKPRMIFVDSMSDLFHEDIPDEFIDRVFTVMALAPKHIFQVLTKRTERMRDYMLALEMERLSRSAYSMFPEHKPHALSERLVPMFFGKTIDWWTTGPIMDLRITGLPLPNVWLGTSVENQATADERIPLLLETPAAVRWISAEPLLGQVNLNYLENHGDLSDLARRGHWWDALAGAFTDSTTLDWVVCGGESGPKARPMNISWALDLRYQCREAGVPFFMKQGSQSNWPHWKDISKWVEPLQVREYPESHRGHR